MGLFYFLKGKRKREKRNNKELMFLEEVRVAVIKYFGNAAAILDLKDDRGEPIDFIEAYPELYSECLNIGSPWDRRSLIFSKLDELFRDKVPSYIFADRLIEDRNVERALELLYETGEPEENKYLYYTTYAKACLIIGDYSKAIDMAKKAVDYKPDFIRARIILADAYHLSGKTEEAHEIYDLILNNYMQEIFQKTNDTKTVEVNLKELFSAEYERLRSPLVAIEFLKQHNLSDEAWEWAEDEFYYSPHFRCQHAYWFLQEKGDIIRGFVKFLALVKEMPWVKEAALNTMILFEKIDPHGKIEILREDRITLQAIIEQNGWTHDIMHAMSIAV